MFCNDRFKNKRRLQAAVGPSTTNPFASAKRASRFHHECSSPHTGHRACERTSGKRSKLAWSVSMPVEMFRPVLGHLIITTPITPLRNFGFLSKDILRRMRQCQALEYVVTQFLFVPFRT
jgi:hypothetical protein